MNSNFDNIRQQINTWGEISPFLFIAHNSELMSHEILAFIKELIVENNMDEQSLFHIPDTWESLKIEEMKRLMSAWDVRPRFAFQIFFIENISRMTLQTQNACLKFFEEPWIWNIIFLSNASESWIIETILSRVQKKELRYAASIEENPFYRSLFTSHIQGNSLECITYFFSAKLEKIEYASALKTLLLLLIELWEDNSIISRLEHDINGVLYNNLQGKYIIDKYIVLLTK